MGAWPRLYDRRCGRGDLAIWRQEALLVSLFFRRDAPHLSAVMFKVHKSWYVLCTHDDLWTLNVTAPSITSNTYG